MAEWTDFGNRKNTRQVVSSSEKYFTINQYINQNMIFVTEREDRNSQHCRHVLYRRYLWYLYRRIETICTKFHRQVHK